MRKETLQKCFNVVRAAEDVACVLAEMEGVDISDVAIATIAHYSKRLHMANDIDAVRNIAKAMVEAAEQHENELKKSSDEVVVSILDRMKK